MLSTVSLACSLSLLGGSRSPWPLNVALPFYMTASFQALMSGRCSGSCSYRSWHVGEEHGDKRQVSQDDGLCVSGRWQAGIKGDHESGHFEFQLASLPASLFDLNVMHIISSSTLFQSREDSILLSARGASQVTGFRDTQAYSRSVSTSTRHTKSPSHHGRNELRTECASSVVREPSCDSESCPSDGG